MAALTSAALAGDPLKEDKRYLTEDFDGDGIITLDEFLLGTDPFNYDSDNDGLPDGWEFEYYPYMNPADSSDAHEDLDYDPSSNASGYDSGERDADFSEVQKSYDVWASDPDVSFTQAVGNEEGPHYDNYEEYYRPYKTAEGVKLYMHTNPTSSNTDGDEYLDPDDKEPLGWKNDGTTPGGNDYQVKTENSKSDEALLANDHQISAIEPANIISEPTNFDIDLDQPQLQPQQPIMDEKDYYLPDADNDGI